MLPFEEAWTGSLIHRRSDTLFTGSSRVIEIRQVKYLNNILEQDHRFIKRINRPSLGFKAFHSAAATIAGIETDHMIRKGQITANGATAFQLFAQLAA